MKRLELNNKTGFHNRGHTPVIIYDEFNKPFYDMRELGKRYEFFNLPAGEYYVMSGKISELAKPINYGLLPMPNIQRYMLRNPESFNVHYANNSNTGTIRWWNNTVVFDKSLMSQPLCVIEFIHAHECGHRYFDTNEHACDLYAANKLLRIGYNPEQIGQAIVNTLSDHNSYRKKLLVDKLVNRYQM